LAADLANDRESLFLVSCELMIDVTNEPMRRLESRKPDSHKGDYGRVLVLGGSRGMAGAPSMCGMAALRSGTGLVTVATPASAQPTVAAFNPCYMTIPLIEDDYGIADMANVVDLMDASERFDVWAIGPGLGRTEGVAELVAQLYRDIPRPMVVDADGLNALAAMLNRNPKLLDKPAGPRVLTPHPGEFARLSSAAAKGSAAERAEPAAALCRRDSSGSTVVVLKGYETVVCDTRRYAVNHTGNPGMATGGTGDCLTGVLAALIGQRLPSWDAARLAVHVHGLAGDLAAERLGQVSLIASDLLSSLPEAFKQVATQ
jgi:NAD(P)H-hydrate epimerase